MLSGIHHITAISSNPQKNYEFYTQVLGLRLVKKTVNFDAPEVYHLYFGDYQGQPGTILTFFPFSDAGQGRRGTGQVSRTSFSIKPGSLGYWLERLVQKGIRHQDIQTRFGQKFIVFWDNDGLEMELVVDPEDYSFQTWSESPVPQEHQIQGFFGAVLAVQNKEKTQSVLEQVFDYQVIGREEKMTRLERRNTSQAKYLDIWEMTGWPEQVQGTGTVHHIAMTSENQETQLQHQEKAEKLNLHPTQVIDRSYFYSVYFREPSGILLEIATNEPGFAIDEKLEELGSKLKLPLQYEPFRERIESNLPKLGNSQESPTGGTYEHIFLPGQSARTLILLHGTGGNENDLVNLAKKLNAEASILSLRGKENMEGMLRFFKRNADGSFDTENALMRAKEVNEFLNWASEKYRFNLHEAVCLGYSNGANLIATILLSQPTEFKAAVLLKATLPVEPQDVDLVDKQVLLISGTMDQFYTVEKPKILTTRLQQLGAAVRHEIYEEDHSLSRRDIETTKEWLEKIH